MESKENVVLCYYKLPVLYLPPRHYEFSGSLVLINGGQSDCGMQKSLRAFCIMDHFPGIQGQWILLSCTICMEL